MGSVGQKKARQQRLQQLLARNPFLTDEHLAETFQVSIQTGWPWGSRNSGSVPVIWRRTPRKN